MADKNIKEPCPRCGRMISIHLDEEADDYGDNYGTPLNHKFNGKWCVPKKDEERGQ